MENCCSFMMSGAQQEDEDGSGDALRGPDFRTYTAVHSIGQNKS